MQKTEAKVVILRHRNRCGATPALLSPKAEEYRKTTALLTGSCGQVESKAYASNSDNSDAASFTATSLPDGLRWIEKIVKVKTEQ